MGYQESVNVALYELKREGTTGEEVARVANIPTRSFRALVDDTSSSLDNAAALLVTLASLGKSEPLELVARDAGFLLVPVPTPNGRSDRSVIDASSRAIRRAADLIDELGTSLRNDDRIDEAELARIKAAARKAQEAIAGIVALAEAKHEGQAEARRRSK